MTNKDEKLTVSHTGTKAAIGRMGHQILSLAAENDLDTLMEWLRKDCSFGDLEDSDFESISTVEEFRAYFDDLDEGELFDLAMEMFEWNDIYDGPLTKVHPDLEYTPCGTEITYKDAKFVDVDGKQVRYNMNPHPSELFAPCVVFVNCGITVEQIEKAKKLITDNGCEWGRPPYRFIYRKVSNDGVPV